MISSALLNAQDDKSSQGKKENEAKKSEIKPSTGAKTTSFIEGEIPTPEEQGFEKRIIAGEEVYSKKEGQLIIEYRPKTH